MDIFSRIFKKRELRENMYSAKISTFIVRKNMYSAKIVMSTECPILMLQPVVKNLNVVYYMSCYKKHIYFCNMIVSKTALAYMRRIKDD